MDEGDSHFMQGGATGALPAIPKAPGKRYAATAGSRARTQQNRGAQSQKAFSSSSPFRKLNDEEVFITRETEKQKRKEAKERAKNLKIWDKKTSTSRMPLRRVMDADIPPAQMEDNIYNFNSEQRGYISSAMHIAKSRVQFSREQQMIRPQNIKEFVDQKKEMFLVELSYNTVDKEIQELTHKQQRKATAIETSQIQLDRDGNKLMKFIGEDQEKTKKKQDKSKKAIKECQTLQDENKILDNKINNLRSEISKNKDILNSYDDLRKFIIKISKIQNSQWVSEQDAMKERRLEQLMRRWIDQHKRDTKDDNIIFREDDDLYNPEAYIKAQQAAADAAEKEREATGGAPVASEKGVPAASGAPVGGASGLVKGRKQVNPIANHQLKREIMTDKDWVEKFKMLFFEDLIPVDEDFYEEELCFKDPSDLNKIFSELEEQNLYLILQSQELEFTKEQMHQQERKLKTDLGREVETHKKNRDEVLTKIQESKSSLADLKKKSSLITVQASAAGEKKAAAEEEVNIEEILDDLREDIITVYREYKKNDIDLNAKQTIDILTEIEVELEEKIKEIKYIELIDEEIVTKQEKERKGVYKKEQREKTVLLEKEKEDKKKEELAKRMDRVYQRQGRQAVPRSEKRAVKREVKVVKIDQETLDRQRYLGEMIPEQMMGGAGATSVGK